MFKTAATLAAVSLALMLSTSVSAAVLEYLGPHSTDPVDRVNTDEGVLGFNTLCADAFVGGQMCESIIFLRSGTMTPPGTFIFQWIKPTLQAVFDGTGVIFLDASGTTSTEPGGLSCGGWTSASPNDFGLVVS